MSAGDDLTLIAAALRSHPAPDTRDAALAAVDRVRDEIAGTDSECRSLSAMVARLDAVLGHIEAAVPAAAADADPPPAALVMSPSVRAALVYALWHHQGASSRIGRPIRGLLGIGEHERMTDDQVQQARELHAMREQIATLREALTQLRAWAGFCGSPYSASIVIGIFGWFDLGMKGPLPDLPDWARR